MNKTKEVPPTTIVERYNYDHGLFLKYLQKTGKNIDDLDNALAVANWIKDDIWNGYSEQDKMQYGMRQTTKKGGFLGLGGTVVVTYEQNPDWARDEVNYYQYLAPVFKCVFEAQVIQLTASPPAAKPVASEAISTPPQPMAAPAAPKQPQSAAQNEIVRLESEIANIVAKLHEEEQFVKDVIAKEGKDKAAKNQTVKQKLTIIKQYKTAIEQKNGLIDALKKQDAVAGVIAGASKLPTPMPVTGKPPTAAPKPVAVSSMAGKSPIAAAPMAPTAAPTAAATLPSVAQKSVIQGNLINDGATMCYLDAAMQMLFAIPEIPQFFATNTFDQIDGLKIIDESQRQLRGCTYVVKSGITPKQNQENETMISNAKNNIKLFRLIFETIRDNNSKNQRTSIVSLKFTAGSTQYDIYRTLVQAKGESFLNSSGNYVQADPNEFMSSVFFNNFDCFDIPSIIGKDGVGIVDTLTITCSGGKIINRPANSKYNTVLPLSLDSSKSATTIQNLIDEYTAEEPTLEKLDNCGTVNENPSDATLNQLKDAVSTIENSKPIFKSGDSNTVATDDIIKKSKEYETVSMRLLVAPTNQALIKEKAKIATELNVLLSNGTFNWADYFFNKINAEIELLSHQLTNGYTGIQTSQQRTLIPQKHVIFHTERKAATQANPMARNETSVDITKVVQINGLQYRIKGCIFHSGSGLSGHYVYGAYDDQGNPQYVINDIQKSYQCKFDDVFGQTNGWLSTTYLYTRV